MLHHISIAAQNPAHVAQVLAEVFHGQAAPFPFHPGSFIAIALDEFGTMIEVHPAGTELVPGSSAAADGEILAPGSDAVVEVKSHSTPTYSAVHAAISVPASREEIEQIAQREGWRSVYCTRGEAFFDVIEFWVENTLLLEFLTSEMAPKYTTFMQPENLAQLLATPAPEPVNS